MKKKTFAIFVFLTMLFIQNSFADGIVNFTLEITGIRENAGRIHVDLFSNKNDYRRVNPNYSFLLESISEKIIHSFDIPEGEYVIAIFQDTNNNGKLDTNFFGMPREPFGISNYRGGIPINFDRLKFPINRNSNTITISLE